MPPLAFGLELMADASGADREPSGEHDADDAENPREDGEHLSMDGS
jgi:hypothetical protein